MVIVIDYLNSDVVSLVSYVLLANIDRGQPCCGMVCTNV
jgi:hypothetical protein